MGALPFKVRCMTASTIQFGQSLAVGDVGTDFLGICPKHQLGKQQGREQNDESKCQTRGKGSLGLVRPSLAEHRPFLNRDHRGLRVC